MTQPEQQLNPQERPLEQLSLYELLVMGSKINAARLELLRRDQELEFSSDFALSPFAEEAIRESLREEEDIQIKNLRQVLQELFYRREKLRQNVSSGVSLARGPIDKMTHWIHDLQGGGDLREKDPTPDDSSQIVRFSARGEEVRIKGMSTNFIRHFP